MFTSFRTIQIITNGVVEVGASGRTEDEAELFT